MPIENKEYNIGDMVWIHSSNFLNRTSGKRKPGNPLMQGEIVHVFILPNTTERKYVIEIQTHIEPIYEVREWDTISDDGKSINLWKKMLARFKL